jgi:hypothetical protein
MMGGRIAEAVQRLVAPVGIGAVFFLGRDLGQAELQLWTAAGTDQVATWAQGHREASAAPRSWPPGEDG